MERAEKVPLEDAGFLSEREYPDESPAATVAEKRRLLRLLILLALVGASLTLVVLWQRDTTVIRKSIERLEPYRRTLQAELDRSQRLPLAFPKTEPGGKPLPEKSFVYLEPDTIRYLRDYEGPVLLGFSMPMSAALRADGRGVLWCDRGRCEVRWMSHGEIAQQRKLQDEWIRRRQEELLKGPARLP